MELARISKKKATLAQTVPNKWQERLPLIYPKSFSKAFAEYHGVLWQWIDDLTLLAPPSLICIWPRGSGKSTDAEVADVEVGASGLRKYCWYVRETQDQADKSVENIGALLESPEVERYYPLMAERALTKYGKPKGWRRNRLATAQGFTVDAMGLDTAIRGVKVEENRPDFIILVNNNGPNMSIGVFALHGN